MTLMCLARAPEIFKVGVSVAPVSQWELYDTHYTERYLATPQTNPTGYESSSVFPYLDQLRGKLLLMHGMADDNVLFTHSTKLFKALQSKNIAFEMMTYPGAKHALQEKDVAIHRYTLILDFFERNL
jgi:dipeptidyl-peptidase-4